MLSLPCKDTNNKWEMVITNVKKQKMEHNNNLLCPMIVEQGGVEPPYPYATNQKDCTSFSIFGVVFFHLGFG